METIRCNQSKAARKPSAMLVVSWMRGLVSRPARTESRKPVRLSCRSVCSRPGSSSVFVPRVKDHSTIHTSTTPSTRAQRGTCRPGFSGGGGPWAPDAEGAGAIVAVMCAVSARSTFSSATTTLRIASSSTIPTSFPSSTTCTGCAEARAAWAASRMMVFELITGPSEESSGRGWRITHFKVSTCERGTSEVKSATYASAGAPTTSSGAPTWTTSPSRRIMIRSPSFRASARSWVMNTIVLPTS